ncbi:MAG: helix-turn-helix domain-containing protein [Holophagaceae bacterium]|nr:helix-turn-helix domain-containing protein [Holophagaceae bacterium]
MRLLADLAEPGWVARLAEALQQAALRDWATDSLVEFGTILHERILLEGLDEAVMAAVLHILKAEGSEPVGELANRVGLSAATLRRRFRAEVELSPKELARVRRVRASGADALAGDPWAGIAAKRGFSDQAHLVREFQELMGRPPEAFRAHGSRIHHRFLKT